MGINTSWITLFFLLIVALNSYWRGLAPNEKMAHANKMLDDIRTALDFIAGFVVLIIVCCFVLLVFVLSFFSLILEYFLSLFRDKDSDKES